MNVNLPPSSVNECGVVAWYAMRALYGKELKVQELLNADGIETFLPMRTEIRTIRGRKTRVTIPAVSNLIFVRGTKEQLHRYVRQVTYFQFILSKMNRQQGGLIIVPDNQMRNFMLVAGRDNQNLLYFLPGELNLTRGQHVRIHGGVLDGAEGIFLKVKGARARRIVVQLDGILAVAAEVEPEVLEIIK